MANEQILVVEDESMVAEYIQQRLISFGYSVPVIAATGEEAITKTAETHPDLIFMDIRLRGRMDGVEAARNIRERFDIPVVYLTGHSDDRVLLRAKETEPFGFLIKPFDDRELHTSIELALYKHQAERRLRQIEHWFTATIRCMGDAVIVTDTSGRITLINSTAESVTGWKQSEAFGKSLTEVLSLIDEESRSPCESPINRTLHEGVLPTLTPGQTLLVSRTGAAVPIEGNASTIRDDQGNVTGVVLIFRDITRRKKAEAQLKGSREQLRALSARLQSVREEERKRIAREIHDELGQVLTGLKMDLSWLTKRLPPEQAELAEKTRSITALVDDTIQSVRKLATELRPGLLDDLGLIAAIEWQAEEFQARTEIQCHCVVESENIRLEATQATAVFRILQETLTNITRHAHASRVDISLKRNAGVFVLTVEDDGRGITEAEIADPTSLGLAGIRERALILGGEVRICGRTSKGTRVTVTIPLSQERGQSA